MQINVTTSVVPVYPSGAGAALTLFNNGPGLLYLGSDTSLAVNNGFPITAGSAIVWDKGQPLYVVSNSAATLFLIENSGPSALGQLSLAPGASIGLAPGSQVALADGSTVGVTSLPPDTSKYWPCISGENYPPTFGNTNIGYATLGGNPCVKGNGTSGSLVVATWTALARYGPSSVTGPTVITGLIHLTTSTGNAYLTWRSTTDATTVAALVIAVSGSSASLSLAGTALDVSDFIGGWCHFELVYTKTMTRLTVNNDVTRRITVAAMADSLITAAFNFNCSGSSQHGVSNLFVSYPDTVSA